MVGQDKVDKVEQGREHKLGKVDPVDQGSMDKADMVEKDKMDKAADVSLQQVGGGSQLGAASLMFADEADSLKVENRESNEQRTATKLGSGILERIQTTHQDNRTKYREVTDAQTGGKKDAKMVMILTTSGDLLNRNNGLTSELRKRTRSGQDRKPSHSVLEDQVFGQGPQQAGDGVAQWQDEEINHALGWQDVAGGAVSGIVLVILLVGLVFWVRLRKDKVENQVEGGVVDLDSVSLDNEDLKVVASILSAINTNFRKTGAGGTGIEIGFSELQKKPSVDLRDAIKSVKEEPLKTTPPDFGPKFGASFKSLTVPKHPSGATNLNREKDRFDSCSQITI